MTTPNYSINFLLKHGFEPMADNDKYLVRYIPDELDYFEKGGCESIDMPYYRTLYYDKKIKRLFAYNDYLDRQIELKDEYISDLLGGTE